MGPARFPRARIGQLDPCNCGDCGQCGRAPAEDDTDDTEQQEDSMENLEDQAAAGELTWHDIEYGIAQMAGREAALRAAADRLLTELDGFLGLAAAEIHDVVGTTNLAVLRGKIAELKEALQR